MYSCFREFKCVLLGPKKFVMVLYATHRVFVKVKNTFGRTLNAPVSRCFEQKNLRFVIEFSS
jgi:energy-coupling factor transporter transmembrane protein EcfT